MVQSLPFIVLNMNLALKFTCINWITVDLEFSFADFDRFLGSNRCFDETSHGFIGLQRFIHVVNPKILHGFEKKLGFHSFLNRTFRIRTDLCWFSFADVHAYESGKFFWFFTWFWFGDSILSLRNPSTLILLLILRLKSGNKLWFFFLLPNRFGILEFFTFFFFSNSFCDRAGFVASGDGFGAWIAERRFNDDGSALNHWESTKTPLNFLEFCFWNFRVHELFLVNFSVLILTAKRESVDSVCEVARNEWDLLLTCTVVAFYRLPHVSLSQWTCDMWTFPLAWHLWTESEKKKD